MADNWTALDNQFVNATKGSSKKAAKLSNYHEAFLWQLTINDPGDPDWLLLHDRYLPFHTELIDKYVGRANRESFQMSKTVELSGLLTGITVNLYEWDFQVQLVYRKSNPQYSVMFPKGHKPFQNGGIGERILAVKALGKSMDGDPALTAVKALVDAYAEQLDKVRDAQEAAKAQLETASNNLIRAVVAAMIAQWRNMGFLINKYFDTPAFIVPFFDVHMLSNSPQTLFTATLAINQNKYLFTRTLTFDSELKVKVTGPGPVNFYLSTIKNGTDSSAVAINADTEQTVLASDFGITEYGLHRHLTAINASGKQTHISVEIE